MFFNSRCNKSGLSAIFLALVLLIAGIGSAGPVQGEYLEVSREPVRVHYLQEDEKIAMTYLEWTLAWVPRPEWMRGTAMTKLDIYVAPSLTEFQRLTGGMLPEWGVACAIPEESLVIVRSPRIVELWREEPGEVLSHEISHVFLYQYLRGANVPRWFHEGFALYCSRMWDLDDFLEFSVALLLGRTFPLTQLASGMPTGEDAARRAYLQSYTVVEYMFTYWNADQLELLFHRWREEDDLDRALRTSLGLTLAQLEERWAGWAGVRYGWLKLVTSVTLLWIIASGLFLAVYVTKRRKFRKKLADMQRREEEAWRRALPGVFVPPAEEPGREQEPRQSKGDALAGEDDELT